MVPKEDAMNKLFASALISLTALVATAPASDFDEGNAFESIAPGPEVHVWINPMVGKAGPGPALGIGLNASRGSFMGSARFIAADEICIFCDESEEMRQSLFLFGVKREGALGYFAVMSGLSRESGIRKENFVREGTMFTDSEYDVVSYDGFGVPIVVDMNLTTRYIGIGTSFIANINNHNSRAGLMLSLPLGSIRR